jgi:transcriptional regulator with XRE-family HTH domain
MSIGLRIKELRNKKKLSQDDFASSIGIKRANLSHIENENQLPTIEILSNIARIYNISYDFLIDGSNNYENSPRINLVHDSSYCPICSEKDKRIKVLEALIEMKDEKINKLKSQTA